MEEFEYILATRDRLLNTDRSVCRLFAVANRKQNFRCVRWTEWAPALGMQEPCIEQNDLLFSDSTETPYKSGNILNCRIKMFLRDFSLVCIRVLFH